MRWGRHVAHTEEIVCAYRIMVRKHKGETQMYMRG